MARFLKFLAVLVILLCSAHAVYADESALMRVQKSGVLRCGYIIWQPYVMKDPNTGALSGFNYDVFEALAKILDIKIDWVMEVPISQDSEALSTGKIDAVCGSWPINPASAKYVDYLQAFAYIPFYLYEKKGGKTLASLKDVNAPDVSLSAMDGDISLRIANDQFPKAKKVTIPSSADPTEINLNVLTNKADLVVNDPLSVHYFNEANKNMLIPVLNGNALAMLKTSGAVAKDEGGLLRMLNEGVQILVDTGKIESLLLKWDPTRTMLKSPIPQWKS